MLSKADYQQDILNQMYLIIACRYACCSRVITRHTLGRGGPYESGVACEHWTSTHTAASICIAQADGDPANGGRAAVLPHASACGEHDHDHGARARVEDPGTDYIHQHIHSIFRAPSQHERRLSRGPSPPSLWALEELTVFPVAVLMWTGQAGGGASVQVGGLRHRPVRGGLPQGRPHPT